jgi:hypothetical protein
MTTTTDFANPAPAPFANCEVITTNGAIVVPCEPISDDLAITPVFGMDALGNSVLGGDFVITHRATGRTVSDGPGCIECCRSAGKALVATGVDWSLLTSDNLAEQTAAWGDEVRRAVAEARTVNWSCDAEDCEPWPGQAVSERTESRTNHLRRVVEQNAQIVAEEEASR